MRIMIVDDNRGIREVIRAVVCNEDDVVLECSGGVDAVSRFEEFHPDVTLMDIAMKDLDGFAAASSIRAHDPSARIVFVTNYDVPAFRAKARELHASGFVSKENLAELVPLLHR